jgi:phosphatidate cytidylyltransferase
MLVYFLGVIIAAWLHILRGHPTLDDLAVTVFGMTYVGLVAAHYSLLHAMDPLGAGLVTMTLAAVALSDTGAYFAGKNFGRHKMAPRVSPKKTWEGSIGGLLLAMAGMGVIYGIHEYTQTKYLPAWPLYRYVFVGLVLAIVGQVGDLVESMLKRDAGVKDSGQVLPGHGGVLDRCDGFLFAGPVMYYLLFLGED